jgi:chaperonin cofactor prefoldin
MNFKYDMNPEHSLYVVIEQLKVRIEELEDRCLGYKYDIQELELNVRELQSQIQAVDDRIDILRGEDNV